MGAALKGHLEQARILGPSALGQARVKVQLASADVPLQLIQHVSACVIIQIVELKSHRELPRRSCPFGRAGVLTRPAAGAML